MSHPYLDINLTQLKKYNIIYQNIITFMMSVKSGREILFDKNNFEKYIVEELGFRRSEKDYNFIIFRHKHLLIDIDKLTWGMMQKKYG